MIMRPLSTLVMCAMLITSCAIGISWPHENFKEIYGGNVGKNIDDPSVLAGGYPKEKVGSRNMVNGNMEISYRLKNPWGVCYLFYEVDPKTRVIVDWRYEGANETCVAPP